MNVFLKSILFAVTVFGSVTVSAADKKNLTNIPVSNVLDQSVQYTDQKLSLELFSYEEYVYSQSRKAEIGDQIELTSRFRYQISDEAWMSLGFRTDPSSDRFDNKTSDFELRAGYNFGDLIAQIDLSLNTNDDDGGISIGFDIDSENTFLRYMINENFQFTFFPLNFDGEVGVEFKTGDVTRIYYVDGTPSNITLNPDPNDPAERIASKTIPGFELRYADVKDSKNVKALYVGFGAASYEYPNDPGFDITQTSTGNTWARRETLGYKFGGILRTPQAFSSLQFVGHSEDRETGALLKNGASVYSLFDIGSKFISEVEVTASEGGSQPYRISRTESWFDRGNGDPILSQTSQRVYKDNDGNLQNWVGKWGSAASLKLGLKREGYTPYFSYKFQDKNFVFSSRTSAHVLRTNNQGESHGGLHRIGFGAYFYNNNFIINPRFEFLKASNNVFADDSVITDFNPNAILTDTDYNFFINVSYFYDKRTGPRTFRL
jgi:hypothetical protein